jgi:signal transduction histidine kinase
MDERSLWERAPDPLVGLDDDGVVVCLNEAARTWLGDVAGRPFTVCFEPHDGASVRALAARGWVGASEQRFSLADGRRVSLNAGRADDTHWQVTLRDITHRQVIDDVQEERRRIDALAELAGAVARELNDPVSNVLGRLELVVELGEELTPMVGGHLSVALDHMRRIAASLRNLRLVGVRAGVTLEVVFVSEVLDEAFDLVGRRARDRTASISIDPELAAGADRATCARILAIVLGHVTDTTRRETPIAVRAAPSRDGVLVEIGAGLDLVKAAMLPVDVIGADGGANGLGLTIAATLVRSMGGRVEARRGLGASFVAVELPRAPVRRQRPAAAQDAKVVVVGSTTLCDAARGILEREGVTVDHVADGETALTSLVADEVAAILTDLLLPGMSGLAFAEEVQRRHPSLRERVWLASEARLLWVPRSVRVLPVPLQRDDLLDALGRRARRSAR